MSANLAQPAQLAVKMYALHKSRIDHTSAIPDGALHGVLRPLLGVSDETAVEIIPGIK